MISGQIFHNSPIIFPSFISLFILTGLTYVIPHEIIINPIKENEVYESYCRVRQGLKFYYYQHS